MATYQIPGQNLNIELPDEGAVLLRSDAPIVMIRKGLTLYQMPRSQWSGRIDGTFQYSGEMERILGTPQDVAPSTFQAITSQTPRVSGEVLTQTTSKENPQARDVFSSTGGQLIRGSIASATPSQQQSSGSLTGNPILDETLVNLQSMLDQLSARGQVLNPNIEITPEKAAEFLRVAENEIDPYYKSQLGLAREGLLRAEGYSRDEILRTERDLETKYQTSLRTLGEQEAERGFALSGIRQRSEQDLASEAQRQIDLGRSQAGFQLGTAARTFAQQYGQPPEIPTISEAPRVLAGVGQFERGSRQLPLYELSPETYQGLVGEQEFARRGAIQTRVAGQEEAFRTLGAVQQQRQLIV